METLDLQSTTYDCGPAALRAALQLLGRHVTLRDLTRWAGTTPRGTSAAGLKRALDRLGVTFREYSSRSRLQAWRWARRPYHSPALLSFDDDDHWVLLVAAVGRTVIIFDPEVGLQVYTRKDFLNRWQAAAGHIYALQLVRS